MRAARGTVHAHIDHGGGNPCECRRCDQVWCGVLDRKGIELRKRRATEHERHGMLARIARTDDRIVISSVRLGHVGVRSGAVMMFRMIVIGVDVDVQRGCLALRRDQGESEEDRNDTMHEAECM